MFIQNTNPSMRNFNSDLELGHRAEEYVLEQLKVLYPTMRRIEGKNVHYDLIDDNNFTIEVKLDLNSKETKRIGIEYMHRGLPSGISISKANRWVLIYYLEDRWVLTMMDTDKLRKYIKQNRAIYRRYLGDRDKSSLLLIDTSEISNHFGYYEIREKQSYNNIPDKNA